jgi:exodeoxyribonuclease VII large subunit
VIAGRDLSRVPKVSVRRIAAYLRKKVEDDPKLAFLGVEGEVSNLRVNASGHAYFAIKDAEALLECVAFATDAATFPELKNGTAIIAYGKIATYAPRSIYQLTVRHVELAGLGRLFQRYDELKRKLQAEGLFDEARKRPLPRYPFRAALVGSKSGDGTRDFLTQARLRAPQVEVELFEAPVQGDVAPQIIAALARAAASKPDLLVLARGGGSFEDLFVFNDERLVRWIVASPIPIVTAIGHEADTSLADLAADRRAPTPSTAAQTVLPRRDDLLAALRRDLLALNRGLKTHVVRLRYALEKVEHRSALADPTAILATRRQRVDGAGEALQRSGEQRLRRFRERLTATNARLWAASPEARLAARRERLTGLRRLLSYNENRVLNERLGRLRDWDDRLKRRDPARRLSTLKAHVDDGAGRLQRAAARSFERRGEALRFWQTRLDGNDPEALLKRGFAIVKTTGGEVVRDAAQAPPGTRLQVTLARGELKARVERDGPDAGEQIGLF